MRKGIKEDLTEMIDSKFTKSESLKLTRSVIHYTDTQSNKDPLLQEESFEGMILSKG